MKNTERKFIIACIIVVSFFTILAGRFIIYNTGLYPSGFEMNINDVHVESETQEETYIVELKNFRAGEYSVVFDYVTGSDAILKVYSIAGYDYKTDAMPVFMEKQITAGDGAFNHSFTLDDEYQGVTFVLQSEGPVSLTNIKVVSDDVVFADRAIFYNWLIIVVAVLAAYAVYLVLKTKERGALYPALLVLLCLVAICLISNSIYLFTDNSVHGCDVKFHLFRTKAIAESMLNGNIPNRLNGVSYFGYGYANPLLYPELFLYIPAAWITKGMSDLGALKLFCILINCLAVFVAYYSFDKMSHNRYISLAATVLYTMSSYKLINIYVRVALGETLFMTFLPLAVYALYTFFYEEKPRWFLLALSVGGIVQSQILGVLLTCIILGLLFVLFTIDKVIKKEFNFIIIKDLIKSVIWVAVANLWFIVPFLNAYFNYDLIMFNQDEMTEWFFNELLSAKGFLSPFIMAGDKSVFSSAGVVVLAGICGAIALCCISLLKFKEDRGIVLPAAIMTVFFAVICTDIIDWQKMMSVKPIKIFMTTLQFAFRFEALFLILLCFVIVFTSRKLTGRKAEILSAVFALIILVATLPNMADFAMKADFGRTDNTYGSYGVDQVLEYLKPGADMQREVLVEKEVTRSDNISISSYTKDGINIDFSVKTDGNNGWIQLPLFYYDDYYAVTESGDRLKVYSDDRALLYVEIPENMGEEVISVRFGDSWIYRVPLYISAAFIAATFMALLLDLYKRKIK